jgi:hypothetical protein
MYEQNLQATPKLWREREREALASSSVCSPMAYDAAARRRGGDRRRMSGHVIEGALVLEVGAAGAEPALAAVLLVRAPVALDGQGLGAVLALVVRLQGAPCCSCTPAAQQ